MQTIEWGCACAAYQVEGAYNIDGKELSIWDDFCTKGIVKENHTGNIATNFYYHYEKDILFAKEAGFTTFRLSIAWSRVLNPITGEANPLGVKFYHNVLDCLQKHNLKACVTLYHWDLPMSLQTSEFCGWTDERIRGKYLDYAKLCFKEFGSKVASWVTFNEPRVFVFYGYGDGTSPPSLKGLAYVAVRNVVISHALVTKYFHQLKADKAIPDEALIGITLNMRMYLSQNNTTSEHEQCNRQLEEAVGIWSDSVIKGDYPESLKISRAGQLVLFTEEEKELLRSTHIDFLGVNYYSSTGVKEVPTETGPAKFENVKIGKPTGAEWLWSYPDGMPLLFKWLHERYPAMKFMVTENGCATNTLVQGWSEQVEINDAIRVEYYKDHVQKVQDIVRSGVPILAYYAWTITDNFEWSAGYTERFGIIFIDFEDPERKRTPKDSYRWWKTFLSS